MMAIEIRYVFPVDPIFKFHLSDEEGEGKKGRWTERET